MSNPVISGLQKQAERTPAGYPTMPGYQPSTYRNDSPAYEASPAFDTNEWNDRYEAPAATGVGLERVTMDDIIVRTGVLFGIIIAAGAAAWMLFLARPDTGMVLASGSALVAFVLSLVAAFKKQPSPPLYMAFAVFEGAFLGGFSAFMEGSYPGIVIQAILGTGVVFAVVLVLYRMRIVRNSPKLTRIWMIGITGIIGYSLLSFGLSLTGVISTPLSQMRIAGVPLGLIVGILAVAFAVMALITDFDVAERCVAAGMPRIIGWQIAFGLVVTLVWIYLELLRILRYLRSE